jgi:transposase
VRLQTVFNKLLCLQGARVRAVAFAPEGSVLHVSIARRARRHRCPRCSFTSAARYDQHPRTWRHISLGRWTVILHATIARLDCPRHGVLTEAVPWAVPESRFTIDFENLVAWLAREMNKTAITRLLHIAWESVGRIIERVVGRNLDPERLQRLFVIGIDEVSYRKAHKYLSVVVDHFTGDPVWLGAGRTRRAIGGFFDEIGPQRCQCLALVTMDMLSAYIEEVRARAPGAVIAFDPFHVVKLANEAVHEVRRTEARERKGSEEAAVLKGSRWTLLKAPENLRPVERVRLAEVAQLNRRVYRAYLLKEELRALYRCSRQAAPRHLRAWLTWAARSRLQPFRKLAATLRLYRDGVLAAVRWGVSNGRLEGINNKIAVIKRRAYGFHSPQALMAMVYLCCTQLPVELPI